MDKRQAIYFWTLWFMSNVLTNWETSSFSRRSLLHGAIYLVLIYLYISLVVWVVDLSVIWLVGWLVDYLTRFLFMYCKQEADTLSRLLTRASRILCDLNSFANRNVIYQLSIQKCKLREIFKTLTSYTCIRILPQFRLRSMKMPVIFFTVTNRVFWLLLWNRASVVLFLWM
jgi:hypothetical protein